MKRQYLHAAAMMLSISAWRQTFKFIFDHTSVKASDLQKIGNYYKEGIQTLRADGVRQIHLKDPEDYWIEINSASY